VRSNFERCLAVTLAHEGGWADHPKDPGGSTMKGVTIGTYAQHKGRNVTKDELRAISDSDLRAIYRRGYWDKVRGDDLPAGLDLVAFDGAVNSGPSRGAKWVQQALGVAQDGKIGPATIAAASRANVEAAIYEACNARMGFLRGLKTWATFGRGWQSRVDDVRRQALAMMSPTPVVVSPAPETVTKPSAPEVPAPSGGIWAAIIAIIVSIFGRRK